MESQTPVSLQILNSGIILKTFTHAKGGHYYLLGQIVHQYSHRVFFQVFLECSSKIYHWLSGTQL